MDKSILNSFISKYYLGGINNQVKWRISNNTLTVYAGENGKVCKVFLKDFKFPDCELGIFDTNKLIKLFSIISGDISLETIESNGILNKLKASDENFEVIYSLADTLIISKVNYIKDLDNYEIVLNLTPENIDNLIKAKNALSDYDKLLIKTNKKSDECEFIFGDDTGFSNKITYKIKGEIIDHDIKLPFNADIFKDILNSNKDMKTFDIKISNKGLIKFNFESDNMSSEYYLIRLE